MIKIGVIFGGRSGEHEISLMSAASVINALDKLKFIPVFFGITKEGRWKHFEGTVSEIESGQWERTAVDFNPGRLKELVDFALPILHGPYGEDGTIQGMFEMLDIPYAGCGVLASAVAMDKAVAKDIFAKADLPICKHALVYREDFSDEAGKTDEKLITVVAERIEAQVPYPLFVKPANMGSSVGITKAKDGDGLQKALMEAGKYDRRIVIEEGIDCRELETGVIGNHQPLAAEVGEILPSAEFYDYRAKYFDGGQSKICVPADVPAEVSQAVREIAVRAYMALDCAGFARVDFFLEKKTNKIYINEINTIPGFTKFSMFSRLWEEAGVSYSQLIERIVDFGYERYHAKNSR
ncbi:D-alanine--D-alanine ligase [Aminipila butyrica]|uniref:D-alanine--D-alanine ligase n=1 Tax=Aminipila butyrica TaxID=433296 RepID=A0A858BS18_9FIRM|nr:D-alanine--D-alanine ligase family protein [Aminipila butyrica]QIB68132.1 D-alanine--D-alanine ligase [Aminipila butyrica]